MTKKLPTIQNYQIIHMDVVSDSDRFEAVIATIQINDGSETIYVSCEGYGGAICAWYENPVHAYTDLMSKLWNDTQDRTEPGYATENIGMFDQAINPMMNVLEDEFDRAGQTYAERELCFKMAQVAVALDWNLTESE